MGDSRLTGSALVAVVGPIDLPAQTDASNFGSTCSGWRLIGMRHEPHRWPALGSAGGGNAPCPEEGSAPRAAFQRTLLPYPYGCRDLSRPKPPSRVS